MTDKQVAVVDEKTKALASIDYGDMAGAGMEMLTPGEESLPFLRVLQGLSPLVTEGKNAAARPGMIYNPLTEELFDGDKGILFVPCAFEHDFLEWVPRKAGGGLVGRHSLADEKCLAAVKRFNDARKINKELRGFPKLGDNDLVETKTVYAIQLNDELEPIGGIILSGKSTMLKPIRDWQKTIPRKMPKGGPIFNRYYRLVTDRNVNDAKEAWFNIRITNPAGMETTPMGNLLSNVAGGEHIYEAAKEVYLKVKSGALRAKHETDAPVAPPAGASTGTGDDDLPF